MESKNGGSHKKKKVIIIVSLILCVLLCISPVVSSSSVLSGQEGNLVEIKDDPTPLAAGTSQNTGNTNENPSTAPAVVPAAVPMVEGLTQESSDAPAGNLPVANENDNIVAPPAPAASDTPAITPDSPVINPDTPVDPDIPVVDPDEPVDPDTPVVDPDEPVDPDTPVVDPDEPVDPDIPVVDPGEPSGTNTEITLAYAQRVIEGYNACGTDKERQEYFGITNNNFSNDTFRNKLQEIMGDPLPLENSVVEQAAYCSDLVLYLHVYFIKDGNTKAPVVYATTAGTYNGSGRWNAWMIYLNGTWYESQSTHAYSGSHQPTTIASFNSMDIPAVAAMLNDPAQFLPLGATPAEEEIQAEENTIDGEPESLALTETAEITDPVPAPVMPATAASANAETPGQPASAEKNSMPVEDGGADSHSEPVPALVPETTILPEEEASAE